ncbi:MAG: IS1 family transposase [Chloroflexi bacterium]|nr:IS1 family transposase [Chloroflexota bacterium]
MNLEQLFCPNIDCPARGQANQGNLVSHSQIEKRCLCSVCNKSFAITKGTLFYRLRTDPKVVMCVIVLLAYGCPTQAIVQAFGFDERTVKNWWERAGHQCEAVHEHLIGQSQLDLQQVQADEIKAKILGGSLWLAMAIMVSTRLWLGGVASPHRDLELIQSLADRIRAMALCRPLLLAVDGLPGYPKAFQRAFRSKVPRSGKKGRPQLYAWPDIAIVQVIKRRLPAGLEIERRIVQGCPLLVKRLRQMTQNEPGVINTAYIERLNATFRMRLSWLTRRTRTLAQQPETLTAGLFIVGCFYNLCDPHHSLRLRLSVGRFGHRWVNRTPAMAAALTDHIWTVDELLKYRVPTPRWKPPKQRGRRSKELLQVIERWC